MNSVGFHYLQQLIFIVFTSLVAMIDKMHNLEHFHNSIASLQALLLSHIFLPFCRFFQLLKIIINICMIVTIFLINSLSCRYSSLTQPEKMLMQFAEPHQIPCFLDQILQLPHNCLIARLSAATIQRRPLIVGNGYTRVL